MIARHLYALGTTKASRVVTCGRRNRCFWAIKGWIRRRDTESPISKLQPIGESEVARPVLRCDQKTLQKDLTGRVYIVTGANSGVGLETTRQLVRQGGHVVMACRRVEAGEEEAKTFQGLKGSWEVMRLDLVELQSVRDFVKMFSSSHEGLDGLVCNAGAVFMGKEATYTVDGFERTIGVNYLAHFLLTELPFGSP